MRCQIAREEGGLWEDVEIPDIFRVIITNMVQSWASYDGHGRYGIIDLTAYGAGIFKIIKFPDGMIFDTIVALSPYRLSGWYRVFS